MLSSCLPVLPASLPAPPGPLPLPQSPSPRGRPHSRGNALPVWSLEWLIDAAPLSRLPNDLSTCRTVGWPDAVFFLCVIESKNSCSVNTKTITALKANSYRPAHVYWDWLKKYYSSKYFCSPLFWRHLDSLLVTAKSYPLSLSSEYLMKQCESPEGQESDISKSERK